MDLQRTIQRWIKEAWAEANPKAELTTTDRVMAFDLSETAERQVQQMRAATGMTWEQAWSEIAPEVLGTPQPSVAA